MAGRQGARSRVGSVALWSVVGAVALAGASVIAATAVAAIFARTVVTPPTKRIQDLRIRSASDSTVTLSATIDSMTPGSYGLWFSDESGHARVGEILSYTRDWVTRQLLGVDFGDLATATRGRLDSWYYLTPSDLGLEYSGVEVTTELGPAPAWLVPAEVDDGRWVIQVHGRAVLRTETLRALPVFHDAGYTSLLISYRNDGEAPRSPDHRYSLGDAEWRDVDSALSYAIEHGAREIVLMGWSMGGATVLQTAIRSRHADRITGIVLESPVVDWVTALEFQGVLYRLPQPVRWAVLQFLSRPWARVVTGQQLPIDLARLDLVTRAAELRTPVLLFHSEDDGYVPATASTALAHARPDIVTYEHFRVARHVRLWNYDRDRWNAAITRWLAGLR